MPESQAAFDVGVSELRIGGVQKLQMLAIVDAETREAFGTCRYRSRCAHRSRPKTGTCTPLEVAGEDQLRTGLKLEYSREIIDYKRSGGVCRSSTSVSGHDNLAGGVVGEGRTQRCGSSRSVGSIRLGAQGGDRNRSRGSTCLPVGAGQSAELSAQGGERKEKREKESNSTAVPHDALIVGLTGTRHTWGFSLTAQPGKSPYCLGEDERIFEPDSRRIGYGWLGIRRLCMPCKPAGNCSPSSLSRTWRTSLAPQAGGSRLCALPE